MPNLDKMNFNWYFSGNSYTSGITISASTRKFNDHSPEDVQWSFSGNFENNFAVLQKENQLFVYPKNVNASTSEAIAKKLVIYQNPKNSEEKGLVKTKTYILEQAKKPYVGSLYKVYTDIENANIEFGVYNKNDKIANNSGYLAYVKANDIENNNFIAIDDFEFENEMKQNQNLCFGAKINNSLPKFDISNEYTNPILNFDVVSNLPNLGFKKINDGENHYQLSGLSSEEKGSFIIEINYNGTATQKKSFWKCKTENMNTYENIDDNKYIQFDDTKKIYITSGSTIENVSKPLYLSYSALTNVYSPYSFIEWRDISSTGSFYYTYNNTSGYGQSVVSIYCNFYPCLKDKEANIYVYDSLFQKLLGQITIISPGGKYEPPSDSGSDTMNKMYLNLIMENGNNDPWNKYSSVTIEGEVNKTPLSTIVTAHGSSDNLVGTKTDDDCWKLTAILSYNSKFESEEFLISNIILYTNNSSETGSAIKSFVLKNEKTYNLLITI